MYAMLRRAVKTRDRARATWCMYRYLHWSVHVCTSYISPQGRTKVRMYMYREMDGVHVTIADVQRKTEQDCVFRIGSHLMMMMMMTLLIQNKK